MIKKIEPNALKELAKAGGLPDTLTLEQMAILLNFENYDEFLSFIMDENTRIPIPKDDLVISGPDGQNVIYTNGLVSWRDSEMVIRKDDYRTYLMESGNWPLSKESLIYKWVSNNNNEEQPKLSSDLETQYYPELTNKTNQAVIQFPEWRKTVKKVQKTGNVRDWVIKTFFATTREAEQIVGVLAKRFDL